MRRLWVSTLLMALAVPVVVIAARGVLEARDSGDAEKRAEIERLYEGYRTSFPSVEEISPSRAMELMQRGKALFVDVRDSEEQGISMLPGAVTDEAFVKELDKFKDRTVILYCTVGYRSGKLARRLAGRGMTLRNLRGGIRAWVHDGGRIYDHKGETRRIHVFGRKWDLAPERYESVW